MMFLALLLSAILFNPTTPIIDVAPSAEAVHKFHVSYGQMAVEDNMAFARIRFFRDDLEETLRAYTRKKDFILAPDSATDSLFTRYLNEHFLLEADNEIVPGTVVSSGEETGGPQPMWWYEVQFEAPKPLHAFSLKNVLLFDAFGDQRNIFKIRHFPDEKEKSFYFTDGAETYAVSF